MRIDVQRFHATEKSTIGILSVDGEFQCFTLEDPVRDEKIASITAIPAGEYKIALRHEGGMITRYQAKFGEVEHPGMVWLLDVPNFEFVYIHIGNTPDNTDGCILVGCTYDSRSPDIVGVSTAAYRDLYPQILEAIRENEEVTINVS